MFVAAPSSLLSLVQLAPTPSYMHEFIRTKTCGDEPSPSVEQNLIGSLVGKPARLTTGYTISLSNHALKLIYITLSYNISADPRPTPIAHLGRGWRPACSPAAHMLYFYAPPLRLRRNTHRLPKSDYRYIYLINKPTKLK